MDRLAFILVTLLGTAALPWLGDLPAERSGTVVAVFMPGTAVERVMASVVDAGGNPLRSGGFANVMIARQDEPGLAGRLRAQGAVLVLAAEALPGCATDSPKPRAT